MKSAGEEQALGHLHTRFLTGFWHPSIQLPSRLKACRRFQPERSGGDSRMLCEFPTGRPLLECAGGIASVCARCWTKAGRDTSVCPPQTKSVTPLQCTGWAACHILLLGRRQCTLTFWGGLAAEHLGRQLKVWARLMAPGTMLNAPWLDAPGSIRRVPVAPTWPDRRNWRPTRDLEHSLDAPCAFTRSETPHICSLPGPEHPEQRSRNCWAPHLRSGGTNC